MYTKTPNRSHLKRDPSLQGQTFAQFARFGSPGVVAPFVYDSSSKKGQTATAAATERAKAATLGGGGFSVPPLANRGGTSSGANKND